MNPYANALNSRIAAAYQASENRLGWRFLYSPFEVIERADVAFIGLNPAGREAEPDQLAMDTGSAYCNEVWWPKYGAGDSPLQRQVRALFDRLAVPPERVLAGNLVPFRSPDWKSLSHAEEALAFGRDLWREVIDTSGVTLVVTMGNLVRDVLADVLNIQTLRYIPTGWGRVSAARGEANGVTLVALPHLSRYRIMDRAESADCISALFDGLSIRCRD